MNPDIVRIIDFYLGIPICLILTIWNFFLTVMGLKAAKTDTIKAAMFIELSEMGSTVIVAPTIKQFEQTYPDATVYFVIFEKNRESVDLLGIIPPENVITIRDHSLLAFLQDVLKHFVFKRKRIDVCFDLELFSRCTAILSYMSGADTRIGFYGYYCEGLYRGHLLTHKVSYNPYKHMSLNFYALLCALIDQVRKDPMDIHEDNILLNPCKYQSDIVLRSSLKKRLKEKNESFNEDNKIIVVNPHPGDLLPIRGWGRDHYAELCKQIIDETDAIIIIVGMERHQAMGHFICEMNKSDRCINFMGETRTLKELVELMSFSDVLISNDSGPVHFASLTNIHIIAFYGPETPLLYGPMTEKKTLFFNDIHCSPCLSAFNHRLTKCDQNICLKNISVATVFNATCSVLDN